MINNKAFEEMTSQELYELARQRAELEKEQQKEARKQRIEELRAKRRELTNEFNRQIREIESELQNLICRRRKTTTVGAAATATETPPAGKVQATQKVVDFVNAKSQASTKEIKEHLAEIGVEVANLSQLLAYLKKKGRLSSSGRGMFAAIK